MKGRLDQTALPPPEIAFTDQQSLPKHSARDSSGQLALVKFPLLDNEHLVDQIRVIQKNAILSYHLKVNDIAIFASHAAHSFKRITAQVQRHADEGQSLRPRRNSIPIGIHVCGYGHSSAFGLF
jgi:hypothetical protein